METPHPRMRLRSAVSQEEKEQNVIYTFQASANQNNDQQFFRIKKN